MDIKSKFFLRSRKIQAALILGLSALMAGADSVGVSLPGFLTTDWLTGFLDTITGDSGLGAALLNAYAALALVGSWLRPDGAALNVVPLTGTLKLAPSLRAVALLLALLIPLAAPASAALQPYQPQLRIAWVGQVAGYRIYAYQGAVVPVIEPWQPAAGP